VFGEVRATDTEAQSFVLCQTSLFANHDDDEDDASSHARCLVVTTDDRTGVFNMDGNPVTVADVLEGNQLTAVGLLRHLDNDAGESSLMNNDLHIEDDFVLEAIVLEMGANFERYAGDAQTAVDGDLFNFLLGPNQGFAAGSVIATQIFANTRIFSRGGDELDMRAIQRDTMGIIDGVIALGNEPAGDRLRAALIVLDLETGESDELLSGTIIAVQEEAGTFDLLVGESPRCVDAGNADVYLISDDDGFMSQPGTLRELAAELRADVYGTEGVSGCFVAYDVLVDVS
jgi:hypothetical protein